MGFSKEPEPAEEEPEEPVMTDPPVKAAATLSESEPVSSAEPPAAPVPAPATPAASDGIIVVDVEPSPRAAKFIGTVEGRRGCGRSSRTTCPTACFAPIEKVHGQHEGVVCRLQGARARLWAVRRASPRRRMAG